MASNVKIIIYVSVVVACVAIIVSGIMLRNRKQALDMNKIINKEYEKTIRVKERPFSNKETSEREAKPRKKGWASTFLPFYSLGILGYILFVIVKIMNYKRSPSKTEKSNKMKWAPQSKKGNTKTKITMFELQQLEERLKETEESMQQILSNTNLMNIQGLSPGMESSVKPTSGPKSRHLHHFKKRARTTFDMETSSSLVEDSDSRHKVSSEKLSETLGENPYLRKCKLKNYEKDEK